MPQDFEKQSYWHDRFVSEHSFEWLISSEQFMRIIQPHLDHFDLPARILHLGFGTSDLQNYLRREGFFNITNVDFEPLAADRGRQLEQEAFGDVRMTYLVADVRQLALPSQYDLVIDKSTADAVSCAGPNAILEMADGVRRSLSPGGIWISYSYSSDRFSSLNSFPFEIEIIARIPVPKTNPLEPDILQWCYLLRPN